MFVSLHIYLINDTYKYFIWILKKYSPDFPEHLYYYPEMLPTCPVLPMILLVKSLEDFSKYLGLHFVCCFYWFSIDLKFVCFVHISSTIRYMLKISKEYVNRMKSMMKVTYFQHFHGCFLQGCRHHYFEFFFHWLYYVNMIQKLEIKYCFNINSCIKV